MTNRQIIALSVGAVATATAFVVAMGLLIFGGYFPDHELIIFVSIALGPVAMASVMVGYAVWWLVLFLLTLVLPDRRTTDNR